MSSPAGAVQLGVLVVVLAARGRAPRRRPLGSRPPRPRHRGPGTGPRARRGAPPLRGRRREPDEGRRRRRRGWTGCAQASEDLGWAPPLWLETTRRGHRRRAGPHRGRGGRGRRARLRRRRHGPRRRELARPGRASRWACCRRGPATCWPATSGIGVTDLGEALRTGLSWSERKIDVGVVELDLSGEDHTPRRETFLVMAGLGFDAEVMASVEPRLKERVGWLAYVVAGAAADERRPDAGDPADRRPAAGDPPDEERHRRQLRRAHRRRPAAARRPGGRRLARRRRRLAPAASSAGPPSSAAVLTGSRRGHPVVEHFRCREIEIRAEARNQVQLDGDPAGEARVLRASLEPLALSVRVPPLP